MGMVITTRDIPPTSRHGKAHHGKRLAGAHKFVAIDGEGITLADGTHRYVLIRIGTNPPLENETGLHWTAIFHYLYSHFEPETAYVGFYLGYDFTQIFRSMRENRARKLLTKDGVISRKSRDHPGLMLPVESDGWQFDIMSGRRLRLRPKICRCTISLCKCKKPPWMYICDAGGFFQTSFLVAINPDKWPEPIVTTEEFATIQQGKETRSDAVLNDDMRMYNKLENEVMARLMLRVDEGLRRLGVTLSAKQWFSPAQAAQAWMKDRVPSREDINAVVPAAFREAARASFFGGWFEIFCHGPVPGIIYQYDINSAYPAHAWQLPCLSHGKWSSGNGCPSDDSGFTLARCSVMVPKGPQHGHGKKYIGAMMHRTDRGKICRPTATEGWYWLHEIRAAERAGCCRVMKWHEWQHYEPCSCPSPLRELKDLYLERLRQGKNTPLGRGARLVYNCVYGKLAQNVGNPQFMNFVYASLITAGCRVQILDAIATHPQGKSAVVQVATDAVYFLTPHPSLPISDKLGEWDSTEHHNITLFKPGVYWDDMARDMIAAGKLPQFKARGVSARDMADRLSELDGQFRKWNRRRPPQMWNFAGLSSLWPSTEFTPSFAMITALQALMRNDWSLAGTLMSRPVKQSSNPGDKRQDAYYDGEWAIYRSEPRSLRSQYEIANLGYPQSEPYDERFDQSHEDNPMSDEGKEKFGVTPDGMVDQLMIDAMMPERKWTVNVQEKGHSGGPKNAGTQS
jgi:hypothetical protein